MFNPNRESRLDRLADELRRAPALTPDLISKVIADACTRLPVLSRAGKAARIDRFIEAGAWNDAMLVLIELELPAWKLRRLVYEDGEWFCSLSNQRNLPIALDETADASHDVLPLAVLGAFLEVRRRNTVSHETSLPTVPQVRLAPECAVAATTSPEQQCLLSKSHHRRNRRRTPGGILHDK